MKKPSGLFCPKCHRPIVKGGVDSGGMQRWRCSQISGAKGCGWNGTVPNGTYTDESIPRASADALHAKISKARKQTYVVTAAQNATPVHKGFFASLLGYCKHNGAQLIVIPYRYKNPTSMWSENAKDDDWWAPEIVPYILDKRTALNKHLVLLADVKTQPTATRPLQGFETLTGACSAILGHPKLELTTIATPQNKLPKILTTTGACTERNYIDGKAGKKGEHHHTFGACLVEVDRDMFHLRQLNAVNDGSFIDLNFEYRGGKRAPTKAAALVMGDSHVEFMDPDVAMATWGVGGMVDTLQPEYTVWHDVHDFYSRNHHHKHEPFVNFAKHHAGADNVEKMLDKTLAFVDTVTRRDTKNVFVASNHPDALARWVKEADPKTDPENAIFWAQTYTAMCKGSRMTETGAKTIDPFVYWAKKKLRTVKQARFLDRDESFMVHGIELGFHGDKGANGARGSRAAYAKIGAKTVIGHGHAEGIMDGCYQGGTSSRLKLEYNSGLSGWTQTHCVVYSNGKRCLLTVVKGKWRGSR